MVEIKELLETVFRSEIFKQNFKSLSRNQATLLLGDVLRYIISIRDISRIDDFIISKVDFYRRDPNDSEFGIPGNKINTVAHIIKDTRKVFFNDTESREQQDIEIFDLLHSNYVINGFLYHSFNGAFRNQIIQNGLSATKREFNREELNELKELFERYGDDSVMGWEYAGICSSDDPDSIFGYSLGSPAWFEVFTSRGHHVLDIGNNRTAFSRKDYDNAKINVINTCENYQLSEVERKKVMEFFDKYWNIFCGENSTPQLALIPRQVLGKDNLFHYNVLETIKYEGLEFAVSYIVFHHSDSNNHMRQDIKPELLCVVELPEYYDKDTVRLDSKEFKIFGTLLDSGRIDSTGEKSR